MSNHIFLYKNGQIAKFDTLDFNIGQKYPQITSSRKLFIPKKWLTISKIKQKYGVYAEQITKLLETQNFNFESYQIPCTRLIDRVTVWDCERQSSQTSK